MVTTVLLTAFLAAAPASGTGAGFAPAEAWRSAAMAGDRQALERMYLGDAKGGVRDEHGVVQEDDEAAFWGGAKAAGIIVSDPKVLEVTRTNNTAKVILRVLGTRNGVPVVASVTQAWVETRGGWEIAGTVRSDFVPDAKRVLPQPATPNTDLYASPSEGPSDLEAALKEAGKTHRRVIVVFGGNWCYDCHVLDTTFRSKEFASLVNSNYVVVHINIGDEERDNTELAAKLGVALDKGVPSLGVLEPDGTVVYAQKNGEFESTVKIGPDDVRAFLEKWKRK